jgi:DNA mismatch repair protein MutS2
MIREAKELADQVQKELKELEKYKDSKDRNRKYEEVRRNIREASDKYRDKLVIAENPNPVSADELKIGDRVKVLSLDQKGNVLTLPDDRNELMVQVGLLKINVCLDNITLIQDGSGKKESKTSRYGSLYRSKVQALRRPSTYGEAFWTMRLMDVDKYLDDAYIAGLKEVSVIHGRGEASFGRAFTAC